MVENTFNRLFRHKHVNRLNLVHFCKWQPFSVFRVIVQVTFGCGIVLSRIQKPNSCWKQKQNKSKWLGEMKQMRLSQWNNVSYVCSVFTNIVCLPLVVGSCYFVGLMKSCTHTRQEEAAKNREVRRTVQKCSRVQWIGSSTNTIRQTMFDSRHRSK